MEITSQKIKEMSYVELMAFLEEVNRPPGGKNSVRRVAQNCFITKSSKVLDVGCNTGYCSFEIAHLTKSHVTGIDISPAMINTATAFQKIDPLGHLIKFLVGDARKLPFKNNTFDVVISGGSTAFIDKKEEAIKEYKRVLKPWGFIADINFFYRIKPPKQLLNRLNNLMGISIKPWGINYWLNLYERCSLEKYFIDVGTTEQVSGEKVKRYCFKMANQKKISGPAQAELIQKLTDIMELFNQNHRYLSYGIFIFRKRPTKEQVSLFGA